MSRYLVKSLPFKPHRLSGLSERLMVSHYENNYGGALRRLNAILARLETTDFSKATNFDLNGLKREELIAAGSVYLHELYFDALGGPGGDPQGSLAQAMARDFGSIDKWRAEFTAMGKALGGGSGWVLLSWSARAGRLINQWAADHAHAMPGATPVLALDMYEHAYHMDFGAKAGAYVDVFMNNLHWQRIGQRFDAAVAAGGAASAREDIEAPMQPEELAAMLEAGAKIEVLDVCLEDDRAKRTDMIPSSRILAPEAIGEWAKELPRDRPIAVYCVYGFQVSGEAVSHLRAIGLDARRVVGGIASWHAIGGPTTPLPRQQS